MAKDKKIKIAQLLTSELVSSVSVMQIYYGCRIENR